MLDVEIIIEHKGVVQIPVVVGEVTLETIRVGMPSVIKFSVLPDSNIAFLEGDVVKLIVDKKCMFVGYVFEKRRDKSKVIDVVAYDQLRYLKNKDSYVYENKTASEVVKMIASDFRLKVSDIADTQYKIPTRVESNKSLFDIIQTSIEITFQNRGELYVLFDDCGKLTMKNIADMKVDIIIDDTVAQEINYKSSIDSETYNKIKLVYEDKKSGLSTYIQKDDENISSWGVLQYFGVLQKGENGNAKASELLKLYNGKNRTLTVSKIFGDCRVRAGSMVIVKMVLGDIVISDYMLVEKCLHRFSGVHCMDLELRI